MMKILESVCRVCRQTEEQVRLNSMVTADLLDIFTFTLTLPASEDLDKYYKMCDPCIKLLLQFEQFKKTCIESDKFFRENLYPEVKVEPSLDPLDFVSDRDDYEGDEQKPLIELMLKSNSKLQCPVCGKLFKHTRNLLKHKRTHKTDVVKEENIDGMNEIDSSKTMCNLCGKLLAKSSMRIHLRIHKGEKPYQCPQCDKKFCSNSKLHQHSITHSTERPFGCEVCGDRFKSEYVLKNHLTVHSKTDNQNVCHFCSETFPNKVTLRKHILSHMLENPFKCKLCNKDFVYLSSFKIHAKNEHSEYQLAECITDPNMLIALSGTIKSPNDEKEEERNHVCYICGKGFKQSHCLKIHIRRHTGEKPYQCDQCETRFVDHAQMIVHKRRKHDLVKKFQCDHCSFKSSTITHLTNHMHSHFDEKPFVCDICDAAFKSNTSLVIHRRVHTGEKPYSCTYCAKSFASKKYLKEHLVTHTGDRRFECKICDKKFTQRTPLKKHMMMHQNDSRYSMQSKGSKSEMDTNNYQMTC